MPERVPEEPVPRPRGRCRCGHLPTQHLKVCPTEDATGYRLVPSGGCTFCGEASCRQYVPSGG